MEIIVFGVTIANAIILTVESKYDVIKKFESGLQKYMVLELYKPYINFSDAGNSRKTIKNPRNKKCRYCHVSTSRSV